MVHFSNSKLKRSASDKRRSSLAYVALVSGFALQTIMERIGIAGGTDLKQQNKKERGKMTETKTYKESGNVSLKLRKTSLTSSSDSVNHPSHYASSKIECIDAMEAMVNQDRDYLTKLDGHEYYYWQVIFKYIWRFPFKNNSIEDLKKAQWYLHRLIERLELKK